MILIWLIVIPLAAAVAAWVLGRRSPLWSRWTSLVALSLELVLAVYLWIDSSAGALSIAREPWFLKIHYDWIPQLGISFQLAMDGLSLVLIVLSACLGIVSVVCSWSEIDHRVGFFHFNLLTTLAGIIGVFLATDLILFYFFWEIMLVPMYLLIRIWGHENRNYAAIKFFLFTQAGALAMLVAMLTLYFLHGQQTGDYTFDYFHLLGTRLTPAASMLIMLGFFAAFAVKLPAVPLHTWLPDAHTEAPTAGSVILAGLLLKTGGYGLIRFILPLFPEAAAVFANAAMALGVVGIIYGAILAFAQIDLKRLVAYTSISHLGFVLLGVFSRNEMAMQGAVIQMVCHGISTGALFVLVGMLQERIHSRDLDRMGGLWSTVPRMGGMALVFALASLGLPGFGNFIGEFLILMGAFHANHWMAVLAAAGLVLACVYSLWMMYRVFLGRRAPEMKIHDLSLREMAVMAAMVAAIIWLGVYPQPTINLTLPALEGARQSASVPKSAAVQEIGGNLWSKAGLGKVAQPIQGRGDNR